MGSFFDDNLCSDILHLRIAAEDVAGINALYIIYCISNKFRPTQMHDCTSVFQYSCTDDHNLNHSGAATGLIPVGEVDSAEFAQIHLTVHSYDGYIPGG